MQTLDVTIINTLNGKRDLIQADSNLTYGEIIKMNSLAPPDVVWTVLDEDGNDISSLKLEDRFCKAHIVPGRDIAGGI